MGKAAGILVLLCLAHEATAEPVPKAYLRLVDRIQARAVPATARRGETVVIRVHLDLKEKAFVLPATVGGDFEFLEPSRVDVVPADHSVPVGTLKEPPYRVREIPEIGVKEFRYVEGSTVWEREVVISPEAKPGDQKVKVKVWFHVTNDQCCVVPLKMELEAPLKISDAAPVPVDPKYAEAVKKVTGRK